jgi:flagellar motor switch protein FliG
MSAVRPTARHMRNALNFTGAEKAATLLLAAGKDAAKSLVEHFSEDELRAIFAAAARIESLSLHEIELLAAEFRDAFENTGLVSRPEKVRSLFSAFRPDADMNAFMGEPEVEVPEETGPTLESARNLEEKRLVAFMEAEHPQASAFLLSKLDPAKAAALVAALPPERARIIAERYVSLRQDAGSFAAEFETAAASILLEAPAETGDDGSIDRTAAFLTQMERDESDGLLAFLGARDARRSDLIRKRLFRFEDIILLATADLGRLFDGVPHEIIARAVSAGGDQIRDLVFPILSQRTRRAVEAELNEAAFDASQAAEARRYMTSLGMRLAREGTIALPQRDDPQEAQQ